MRRCRPCRRPRGRGVVHYWNADRIARTALLGRRDLLAAQLGELASSSLSSSVRLRRHLDVDSHDEVAAAPAAQRRHTGALEAEHLPGLRARRHVELLGAVERLDLQASPSAACAIDTPHVQQVVAAALEVAMRGDAHRDVEVAGDAAARRGRAAPGEAQPLTVVDAGGHLDVDRALRVHPPVAAAVAALRRDAPTRAAADPRTARR